MMLAHIDEIFQTPQSPLEQMQQLFDYFILEELYLSEMHRRAEKIKHLCLILLSSSCIAFYADTKAFNSMSLGMASSAVIKITAIYAIALAWLVFRLSRRSLQLGIYLYTEQQKTITHGAWFLKQIVLEKESAKTLKLFDSMDPEIIPYVFTKSIAICALTYNQSPSFLSSETKKAIHIFQLSTRVSNKQLDIIQKTLQTYEIFEATLIQPAALKHFRSIGMTHELRGVLITHCWPQAIENL